MSEIEKIYQLDYENDGTYWVIGFFTDPKKANEHFDIVKRDINDYTEDNGIESLNIKEYLLNKIERCNLNYKLIRSESIIIGTNNFICKSKTGVK